MKGSFVIAQGGGPTAVINASVTAQCWRRSRR